MADWSLSTIPPQEGKVILITGGNSGLGYESALALAQAGATVIISARNEAKGQAALAAIRAAVPGARVELLALNLADLASIRQAAETFRQRYTRLDVLMNNAGVMATPYQKTADGFEMQFGTNHLGHFALTGQLLDLLLNTPESRVVNVSSNLHTRGKMNFADLHGAQRYDRWGAYCHSKLANLLFTYELQRKLSRYGASTIAVGAHPGYAATNLQSGSSRLYSGLMWVANKLFAQSAAAGALSQIYAATMPEIKGSDYIGPDGGMRGQPAKIQSSAASYDEADAARLWEISVAATSVDFAPLP